MATFNLYSIDLGTIVIDTFEDVVWTNTASEKDSAVVTLHSADIVPVAVIHLAAGQYLKRIPKGK